MYTSNLDFEIFSAIALPSRFAYLAAFSEVPSLSAASAPAGFLL